MCFLSISKAKRHKAVTVQDVSVELSDTYKPQKPLHAELVLKRKLLFHQNRAVEWLKDTLEDYNAAFICDDMGLGKTTTVLAYCLDVPRYPTLILTPSGLVAQNTVSEIKLTIAGDIKYNVYPSVKDIGEDDYKSWNHMHFVVMTYRCLICKKHGDRVSSYPFYNFDFH